MVAPATTRRGLCPASSKMRSTTARGARLGDRQVPHLATGARVGTERDERGGDVGRVRVAVRPVGPAHHLRAPAGDRRTDDLCAQGRCGRARPEEVRRPADRHLRPAGSMCLEELGGHGRTRGGLGRRRVRRQRLDEVAPTGRSVGVEVVEDDEPGAGGGGAGEHAALQRGELLGPPPVVGGVEAAVDDVGAGACRGGERRVRCVSGDRPGSCNGAPGTADGDDVGAGGDEVGDDVTAHLTDPDDHVAAAHRGAA